MEWTAGEDGLFNLDYSRLDFSVLFNNTYINVFMMANVVLGLFLLDRYLSNRNKKIADAQN